MLAAIERGKLVKRKEKWPDAQKIIFRPNLPKIFQNKFALTLPKSKIRRIT